MVADNRRTRRPSSQLCLCLACLLWTTLTATWASAQRMFDDATARRLFIEIESARRLPVALQAERLPRIYRDVCPQLQRMYAAHGSGGFPMPTNEGETPADVADRIGAGGWPEFGEAGRQRCRAFLSAHLPAVEILARDDLRAAPRRDQWWALRVIGELRAVRLFDDVIAVLRDPDPTYAAQALRELNDPRAIPPLIRRFPDEPTRFFETLRTLQHDRPAHPLLLELLHANDATTRWQAAYALVESRDPALVSIVPRLVADTAAEVRREAGYIAISLDDALYRRLQPSMMVLLSDPDIGVRSDVAVAMANRHDRVCARALLGLVKQEEMLEPWRQSNVEQAIHTLTGTYFGLRPGTPSPALRDKALLDFAQWIEAHPPHGGDAR